MLKSTAKLAVFVATSAIALPYTIALFANILYGWPLGKDKYKRAFSPQKVLALNYSVLQQLTKLRFTRLYFKWQHFYSTAAKEILVKDIAFGCHENKMDVYMPQQLYREKSTTHMRPTVVFVYGGSWGSGNKNMYGLLCSSIADTLQAVVCCPNYSTYPKGYVDDMVQDIADCLSWIHSNGHIYGADKSRIMIIGHSAGAHLAAMVVLELTLKRLLYNPESLFASGKDTESSMHFEEAHFNGNSEGLCMQTISDSTQSHISQAGSNTGSFLVVDPVGETALEGEKSSDASFMVLEGQQLEQGTSCITEDGDTTNAEEKLSIELTADGDQLAVGQIDLTDSQKIETNIETSFRENVSYNQEDIPLSTNGEETSQQEVCDLLSSIKLVVGLAGVYDISDHYEFEARRGVEDISTMGKAMYSPEHFNRFSPTQVVQQLPKGIRLPAIQMVHGDVDYTVPVESSIKFSKYLSDIQADVSIAVVPECHHEDICLDLMEDSRPHYDAVMGVLLESARKYLKQ